ncbi:MAG: sigma-B regulation protein RsbU (phosphoserine phosphatase) [Paracoccaceae bacterium]
MPVKKPLAFVAKCLTLSVSHPVNPSDLILALTIHNGRAMRISRISEAEICENRAKSVLVVDDSAMQRRLLTCNLERWGYEVLESRCGRDALEICRTRQVDLILSDWVMPEMNGLEFCRQFRALNQENYGYFIMVTSKTERDDIATGLDTGADEFLTKPINSTELRARLRAGERVLDMQKELIKKNAAISENLAAIQVAYAAVNRDLKEAKKLQHSLVPETHLTLGAANISLKLQSSGHIGGDMIGHYYKSSDRVGVFGFDVSGHGISAALMTARLAGCLGASNPAYNIAMAQQINGEHCLRSPAEIARQLNQRMLDEMDTELYFTTLLADICLKTGRVELVQAGHPHPLLQRASGQIEFIGNGGLPIGLIPDATFSACQTKLELGDRLLMYSDGFTEAENNCGKMLDEAGLTDLMTKHANTKGPKLLDALVEEIQTYSQGDEVADDLSAVLVELMK